MDDEEFENPDLIIPPNIKIIDPETLSDEPSTDDMPPELYPEYTVEDPLLANLEDTNE